MAAAMSRMGYAALRHTSRIPARRKPLPLSTPTRRQFHITLLRRAEDDAEDSSQPSKRTRETFKFSPKDLDPSERTAYNLLSPEGRQQYRDEAKQMHDYFTSPRMESRLQGEISQLVHDSEKESPHVDVNIPRIKPGLMSMGEEDEQDSGEDEEYENDDLSSLGHGELEQHREMRHYARIMAWEMPLLNSTLPPPPSIQPLSTNPASFSTEIAKPFYPPKTDEPLRFRYTTYMGETHPAQKKIVLEFCTRDLRMLSEPQRIKLVKLAGPRYNPETDIVKMSSEMFETQAQNKRYLGDLVDTLIAEAQDESDMFEDVPLDFRHHKFKPKVEFPEEWKLNRHRRGRLENDRKLRLEQERQREEEGRMVVGANIIEEAMKVLPVRDESRMLLESQQGRRGKMGGRRGVKQIR